MKRLSLLLLFLFLPTLASAEILSPPHAWDRAGKGELIIIDIRTPPEWAWTGTARTASRAYWWQVSGRDGFLKDVLEITGGERERPVSSVHRASPMFPISVRG